MFQIQFTNTDFFFTLLKQRISPYTTKNMLLKWNPGIPLILLLFSFGVTHRKAKAKQNGNSILQDDLADSNDPFGKWELIFSFNIKGN